MGYKKRFQSDNEREKAIELANSAGLFTVIRLAARASPSDSLYVRAGLQLAELLREAQLSKDASVRQRARKQWNKACGLGAGNRRSRLNRWLRAWCVKVQHAPTPLQRATLVSEFLGDVPFGDSTNHVAGKLTEINGMLCLLSTPGSRRQKAREIDYPITIPLSAAHSWAIMEAALSLADVPGFENFSIDKPGEKIVAMLKPPRRRKASQSKPRTL